MDWEKSSLLHSGCCLSIASRTNDNNKAQRPYHYWVQLCCKNLWCSQNMHYALVANSNCLPELNLSIIRTFNSANMSVFLHRTHWIMQGEASPHDFDKMILYVCCSLIMKGFFFKINKATSTSCFFSSFMLYICSAPDNHNY